MMDKYATSALDARDARRAAVSLCGDFDELIGIFDRQLSRYSKLDTEALGQVREARLAAERGRRLSADLAAILHKRA